MKMIKFYTLPLFIFISAFPLFAQQGEYHAVDDSICLMPGDPIQFNVQDNDFVTPGLPRNITVLTPVECFDLTPDGQLLLKSTTANCCGEHLLRYRYNSCQQPNDCAATLKIVVKCPKPECFIVNLEPYIPDGGSAGNPPTDLPCVYACEKSGATYFVSYNPSFTYSWTVTGGTVSPGGNPAEINVAWGAAGNGAISLSVTNGAGQTTVYDFCVEILSGPTAAFQVSNDSLCQNAPLTFINNSIGGSSFFWDFGDGNTSTMFQPTHQYATPGLYTATLIVTKNNFDDQGAPLCCCADTVQRDIFIDSLPGPEIFCVSTLCAGDSSKYWTNATNCGTYTWTVLDANNLPLPFTGQGNDTICVQWGAGPVGNISLAVANCDSAYCSQPVSVQIPIISPTVPINGLTLVCENGVATYTVPKWLSVAYNWQITGGTLLSGQGTNTITVQWGAAPGPGTINLTYSSPFLGGLPGHDPETDCQGSASLQVNIRTEFDVTGPVPGTVCQNTSSSFTATATPSAAYTWSISPAVAFTGQGTNSINVSWNVSPGIYVVTAMSNNPNAYCNSIVKKIIKVVATPKPTGVDGPTSICPGSTATYFGQGGAPGTGFVWTVIGGSPASFSGNPITVTWNAGGPYALVLQQGSLGAPFCLSDTIRRVLTAKTINGPLTLTGGGACTNSVQSYSVGPAQHPDAVFNWTITPASAGSVISGQGTANVQVQWNNTTGPATLQATVTLCNNSLPVSLNLNLGSATTPTITQTGVLCPGVSATLNAPGGYSGYAWSNSVNTQTTSISAAGSYVLTVTNAAGCTAVATYQAVALPGPTASISTPNNTLLCILPPNNTGSVTMTALTGPGYTYAWYRNGTLLALPPTQSTYTHSNTLVVGVFNYWVVVTDANGCTNQSNTIQVVQTDSCNPSGNCQPLPHTLLLFSTQQSPNCNTYDFTTFKSTNVTLTGWNFGDPLSNANTGTLSNAVHTYTKAGCYLVTLSATVPTLNPPNGLCTITRQTSVCVPLVADFSSSDSCLKVSFTDLSTFLPGQGPVSWSWSFGDMTTSNLQNPMHTYAAGGSYTVSLTVTNASGCQVTTTKTIVVAGLPTPTITANPSPACVGQPIAFSATGSNIVSWLWNFGNGASNGAQNPSQSYLTPNTYNVTLSVVNNKGCQNTVSLPLIVHPSPPADTIAWSPKLTVCAGNSVTLSAPAAAGNTYLWSTGATSQNITVNTAGAYSVVVTNAQGCTRLLDSVTVTVLPAPTAGVSGPKFICDAGCITLSAPLGQGFTYQWLNSSLAPLAGEIGQTINVCDFNLLPAYAVQVTDANGCTAVSGLWPVALAVSPAFTINVSPDSCEGTPATLSINPVQPNVVYSWSNGGNGTAITVLQAGTYTAVGTDTLTGCNHAASAVIHPLPDLCITPAGCYESCNPDTICGPANLAQYQWNLNGVPIPGETNQCLIVTQSGTYSLTGTTSFGCSLDSDPLELTLVDCGCGEFSISADSSAEGACCWTLSYANSTGGISGISIFSPDADLNFDLSSLSDSLSVNSITSNSIGLVNSIPGNSVPAGGLNNFLSFCLGSILNAPQQIIVQQYDWDFEVVCADTLTINCPVEPECLYLQSDTIFCKDTTVVYSMTVCNPVDAPYPIGYIQLMPNSPAGIVVTPNFVDETANPILAGQCRTYTFALTGPNIAGQKFCFKLVAHDGDPELIDSTLCCSIDTFYCIEIPDCDPCDNLELLGAKTLETEPGSCCYGILLQNNYAAGYFNGISLCMLSPGVTMTINNPFGSGWLVTGYTPTVISLAPVPPAGNSLPLGQIALPNICINTSLAPAQFLEIKWLKDGKTICRDTVQLSCEPECGYIFDEKITCDPATGQWVYSGLLKNMSAYTAGEFHLTFTSPPGMTPYNTTISLAPGLPSGGVFPISVPLGAPAMAGDSVCFTASLHALNDDAMHTKCCNFRDCIVLPDCSDNLDGGRNGLVVFPNPSNGHFTAQLAGGWQMGVQCRLYDMPGRLIATINYPEAAGKTGIPLAIEGLSKGMYILEIESGLQRWKVKVAVE